MLLSVVQISIEDVGSPGRLLRVILGWSSGLTLPSISYLDFSFPLFFTETDGNLEG